MDAMFSTLAQEHGVAVLAFDQQGHGYSQGERCCIQHIQHLIDDTHQFARLVRVEGNSAAERALGLGSPEVLSQLRKVPFFLSGESMGGGLAIATALHWHDSPEKVECDGLLLIAPLVKAEEVPPVPVVAFLRYSIAPLFPKALVPGLIEPVGNPALLWVDEKWQDSMHVDKDGQPGALAWGKNMRFVTALALLDFTIFLTEHNHKVALPFLILHDPNDGIVSFEPSERLGREAVAADKSVVPMPGGRHDLITNDPDGVKQEWVRWIDLHVPN